MILGLEQDKCKLKASCSARKEVLNKQIWGMPKDTGVNMKEHPITKLK